MSRYVGLTAAQLAAIAEVCKLSERDSLVLQVQGGELDGGVRVRLRDRWAVEHYHIDTAGILTRPASRTPEVPQV